MIANGNSDIKMVAFKNAALFSAEASKQTEQATLSDGQQTIASTHRDRFK